MTEHSSLPAFSHLPLPVWTASEPPASLGFEALPASSVHRDDVDSALIESRFGRGYADSRDRFLQLAADAGAAVASYPIAGRGPSGEELRIDIAELTGGCSFSNAEAVLVVISGVHGSEGRTGSAIQQEILAARPHLPSGCAISLVHALNPYGMAHEKRNTEFNVDLNRNCTTRFEGVPEGYEEVRGYFTAADARELERNIVRFDSMSAAERGAVLKILAPGQYEYPHDPFFGGRELTPNLRMVRDHLSARLAGNARLLFIDIHTGLGAGGEDTLFLLGDNQQMSRKLSNTLASRHLVRDPEVTIPFFTKVHGSVAGGLAREFQSHRAASLVHEIGTYPNALLSVLALEQYCRAHPESSLAADSRDLSREFFCPADETWRRGVLQRGTDIAARAADALFDQKS